jgi:hypothetical protein
MMSGLNGRVRALERQNRQSAGCPSCGGQVFFIVEPGADLPTWLDAFSCCRACGAGVKLIDRESWDLLP